MSYGPGVNGIVYDKPVAEGGDSVATMAQHAQAQLSALYAELNADIVRANQNDVNTGVESNKLVTPAALAVVRSNEVPLADQSVASAGTSQKLSRADHRHPQQVTDALNVDSSTTLLSAKGGKTLSEAIMTNRNQIDAVIAELQSSMISRTTSVNAASFNGQAPSYYRCSDCSWTCSAGCYGGCQQGCVGGCTASCSGGCASCSGTCSGSCSTGCSTMCLGCSGACTGSCSGGCSSRTH